MVCFVSKNIESLMERSLEVWADVPSIDLSLLRQNPLAKALVIKKIHDACRRYGFFNIINHGIADSVIEEALNVNSKFFEMGNDGEEELVSDDIYKAVRFGKAHVGEFTRDFLKLYAHPLHQFVTYWPRFPPDYREKMGMYSTEVRKLCIELLGAVMESLNLGETHLKESFERGFQILGVNCYPPSLGTDMVTIGTPPHSDHSIITILLQSAPGLDVIDRVDGGSWKNAPELKGSLLVLVGDHLEVISNGLYKSVLHRAIPSCCHDTRLSIASLHSLAMDEAVEPAAKLMSEENPRMYRGSSLRDFLKHLASGDTRPFIRTLETNDPS